MIRTLEKVISWKLFARKPGSESDMSNIVWWELRRIPYNLIVGASGVVCMLGILALAAVGSHVFNEPLELPDPPFLVIFAILAYGIGANICYTGGWLTELLVKRVWKDRAGSFAEIAFFVGLVGSVLLTYTPLIVFTVFLLFRLCTK